MNGSELLTAMASDISSLTFSEKMVGASIVTVLSMAIVFSVLILLSGMIKGMKFFAVRELNKSKTVNTQDSEQESKENIQTIAENNIKNQMNDELIVAITAALAASMGSNASDIRVVNITRATEESPVWAKTGIFNQINSRI